MNDKLRQLQPNALWEYFDSITEIPRGSKKEERIIAFMNDFGLNLGLETIVDDTGNVIIRKGATHGMENRKGIVLQSHLDMVLQKNSDVDFDFDSQGIITKIEGDWITADGTTLGADNGIGVAAIMAILADPKIEHPALDALFTIDEETGMTGAFGLKAGVLKGEILLNLDSEDEGELYIGCAGGINTTINGSYKPIPLTENNVAFELQIGGLKGGHSGMDINLERGNSNKLLSRLLLEWNLNTDLTLSSFDGGSLRNAIPREAKAVLVVTPDQKQKLKAFVDQWAKTIKEEFGNVEPDLFLKLTECDKPADVVPNEFSINLLRAIDASPNGVVSVSTKIEGLVELSTNLARVSIANGDVNILYLSRSSVESKKMNLCRMISSAFELVGGLNIIHDGSYPGWSPNPSSTILKIMKKGYEDLFGSTPEVKAVHAGLECGLLGTNYPDMDMISFGPTIRHPHSPDEKVHIPSVGKFWNYLLYTLKNAPTK